MKTKTLITILTSLTILVITLIFLNNIFVTEPKKQQVIKEFKIETLKDSYTQCIEKEWKTYNSTWENNCLVKGLGENCVLPLYNSNLIEKTFKENKENCLEIYKLELNAIK